MIQWRSWLITYLIRAGTYGATQIGFFMRGEKALSNLSFISIITIGLPIVHCGWEDETARDRTGHQPSYVEAEKRRR